MKQIARLLITLLAFTSFAPLARAEALAQASAGGVSIMLYSDSCALPAVTNLRSRATWTEGGATIEGCWGGDPNSGVVLTYFADKTVVAIPIRAFVPVRAL